MIEAGLQQLLLADPTVGSLIADRVYPVIWPDAPAFPLVTMQRISTVTDSTLSGPISLVTVRMQLDAWGKQYGDTKAVTAALNNVLEGYTGKLLEGTPVLNITLDSSFDLYDSTAMCHRTSSDYLVTFSR